MTLREIILSLKRLSRVTVREDGTREYSFAGKVELAVVEAVKALWRACVLDSHEGYLFASKAGCHVAFGFGSGASTQTFVRFSYVDER